MVDKNREHTRVNRVLTVLYCVADEIPHKWDMSVIENISVGGIKFLAPIDMKLEGKTVQLRIKIPELAPNTLELEGLVLSANPRFNGKSFDVRAKFVNVSEESKERLAVVEKLILAQAAKNPSNVISWKQE